MKQISSLKSRSGFIDPEKVYFVEKFGYLLKKIDNSFGGPVQDALISRIYYAVDKFKTDLPNVVKKLEQSRLTNLEKKDALLTTSTTELPKKNPHSKPIVQSNILKQTIEAKKTESKILKSNIIETEIDVDIPNPAKNISSQQSINMPRSSILRPTHAAIEEEQRQIQLRQMQKTQPIKKEPVKKPVQKPIQKSAPTITKQRVSPNKELTVWEKAWNKYSRYSDDRVNGSA